MIVVRIKDDDEIVCMKYLRHKNRNGLNAVISWFSCHVILFELFHNLSVIISPKYFPKSRFNFYFYECTLQTTVIILYFGHYL